MAEQIGEAVVKISADIAPLKTAVNEAKQATASLSGLKINWGEGSGSLEEYNSWLEKTNSEMSKMSDVGISAEEALSRAGITARSASTGFESVAKASEQTTQATSKLSNVMATIGTAVAHPIDTLKGAFSKLGESATSTVKNIGSGIDGTTKKVTQAKRAVMTWSVVIGATVGKALNAYSEVDATANAKMSKLKENWERLFSNLGAILQPVLDVVNAIVGKIADFVGWVGSLFGITTNQTSATKKLTTAQKDNEDQTEKLNEAYRSYQDTLSQVNEEIADIRKQMDRTTTEYRRNLKQILVDHEKTVNELTQQIEDANVDYQRAVAERNAEFAVSQAEEEKEHQKKVDELMTQINFLQRYNNKYNQEKLSQLQFALAKENNLYQKQTEAEKAQLDLQNQLEKEKADAQIAEYQSELNEELALLNKHRDLLNGVRDEILLDEVESLREQYELQMEAYQKQIAQAQQAGAEAGAKYAEEYSKATTQLTKTEAKKFVDFWNNTTGSTLKGLAEATGQKYKEPEAIKRAKGIAGYADGGYTGQGRANEVAGIVHKGEYVLPQEMVDQDTGTPKPMGNNITINVSGTFATSESEKRKVAQQIANALQQVNLSRLGA